MNELKAHDFQCVYDWLGINLNQLGVVMAPLEFTSQPMDLPLYRSSHEQRYWIDGWVADHKAHVTLLYGLLHKARNISTHIQTVLEGWKLHHVYIDHVGYFESPYPDEDYYCLVAHIVADGMLLEGNQRLSFLPHINTFSTYRPHMTLGYIEPVRDEWRDEIIAELNELLAGRMIKVTGDVDLGRA